MVFRIGELLGGFPIGRELLEDLRRGPVIRGTGAQARIVSGETLIQVGDRGHLLQLKEPGS